MRQLLWISDFLHNNEILLDNTLCSPQFVYIIILIGQMHKEDIQVKPCQVFYFELTPCESSVIFPGHFKNKTNSGNVPTHTQRHSLAHVDTHKHIARPWARAALCTVETLHANCKLFSMLVRLELGLFLGSSIFLALQKAHGSTCRTLFHTRTGQNRGSYGISCRWCRWWDGEVSFSLHSQWKEPEVWPCWPSWPEY